MNSDDDDISNASGGNRNRSGRHVHYLESSISSDDSKSSELDKYLDEAMDSDDEANDHENRHRGGKQSVSANEQEFRTNETLKLFAYLFS